MKICDETVRAAVDSGLGGIQLDAAQKQAILAQCRPTVAVAPPRRAARPLRRVLAVAAAFAVAFSIGGGVLAAAPELRQSLSILGAETLQQLQPINQVSEDQGIRMEVLAAVNDGQVAVVFLSLQDTAGQGRVEPTSQLYDSEISGANFTRGEVVDYDAATGTTVLRLVADASESMAGKKITVSSKSILSGEDRHAPTYSGYTVASLRAATGDAAIQYPQNLAGSMVGGPEMDRFSRLLESGKMPALKAWSEPVSLPGVDWAAVTAAGVVDGQVHVQVAPDEGMGRVNRLYFSLETAAGEPVDCTQVNMELGERHKMGRFQSYNDLTEYVLIPPREIADPGSLRIMVDRITYRSFVEGSWSTTFKLEEASDALRFECNEDMQPWILTSVQVSPVAVTMTGTGEMRAESQSAEVRVFLKNGAEVRASSVSTSTNGEDIVCHNVFDEVIDLAQVDRVLLNGRELPMERTAP
ncbi:hypothetical protein [Allofournierella sp.]|uniref:hypothetical protein n=1 Tax=Allofournierella sp. TaxID=1940256 RepID=UPI003AB428EE